MNFKEYFTTNQSELVNEVQDKVNQVMQFNYIISHNLRSPLANILGLCNILETDADKDEMGVVVDGLKKSAENIDNLIKNLSEILSLSMPLNKKKTWVDMSDLLNHTISIFENQLTESGIEVDISIGENATKVFSICSYIESILYNLLSNAIKYKSPVRKPIISISLFKKEEQFHVIFTDNGIGIDMHRYGKDIFGLYKRFNFETEGKGLGLHMVKVQVQALGGKIDVSSTPGNGSCFSILLPAPEDELMD